MTNDTWWPRDTVRPWHGVLYETQLAASGESMAGDVGIAEYISSSQDTVGEERWRGLIIGQVAQVESSLAYIARQGESRLGDREAPEYRISGYAALARVLTLMYTTGLAEEDSLTALVEAALALRRRDFLIDAAFSAGYSNTPGAGLVHVITHISDGDLPPDDEYDEPDSLMFEQFLRQAQRALSLLATLWLDLDRALPDKAAASGTAEAV